MNFMVIGVDFIFNEIMTIGAPIHVSLDVNFDVFYMCSPSIFYPSSVCALEIILFDK